MLGFKIVRHSLAMVFGNFTEALRIGAVPIIGLSAFSFLSVLSLPKTLIVVTLWRGCCR